MDGRAEITPESIRRLCAQVRTLAAVHDILTQEAKEDGQAHYVSARAVLEKLIPMLQETATNREIRADLEEIRLPARQGSSLALVVNELISNGLKYGEGDVEVTLARDGDKTILQVRDNGPGFPCGFSASKAANTGLELVDGLSRWDLGALTRYENHPNGGACVTVEIPFQKSFEPN